MIKKIKHFQRQKINVDGFSLIELVVAVGVLAILSAVGVIAYSKTTENAREAAVQAAATDVLTGAVAYYSNGDNPSRAAEEWLNSAQKDKNGDPIIDIVLNTDDKNCLIVNAEYVGYGNKAVKQTGKNCVGNDDLNNDDNNSNNGEDGDNTDYDDEYNSEDEEYGVITAPNYGALFFDVQGKNVPVDYTINIVRLDNNENVFTRNGTDSGEEYSYEYVKFNMATAAGVEDIKIFGTIDGEPYSFVREVSDYWNPEIDYGSIIIQYFNINGKEFFAIVDEMTGEFIANDEDPDSISSGGETDGGETETGGDVGENIDGYEWVDLSFGAGIKLNHDFIKDKIGVEYSYIIYDEFGDVAAEQNGVISQEHIDNIFFDEPIQSASNLFVEALRPVDDDGNVILPEYTIVLKVGDITETVSVKDYYTLNSDGKYTAGRFIHNGSTVENIPFGV